MGIPKFFRYISGRYPCISQVIDEYMIPEFDNLYLDTNGIVHVCSHPTDDVEFRITEETIFENIFRYIELLFRMIQPQKLFFLAVDGVAPRAKINHQRSRRFRSAKAAEVQEAQAKAKGLALPTEKKFDPNCITPGTLFMAKLNKLLKYFITYKVSTDRLWQRCKVIYSGSEVPGEGEHKIMDYIRYLKAQPDYDVHTRHCLYGLDADLIMLGLCTHELQFSLLREVVVFGKADRKTTPEETKFCLLHISLLREYIDLEFSPLKETLPFPYDLEKIIDDWVLMSCLVGNDFIPHLPNFVNLHCALPILSCAYSEVLPTLGGYINEAGTLRLDRFEKFMKKLSQMEIEQFSEQLMDIKYFEAKTGRRPNESERHSYKKSDDTSDEPPPATPKKINKELDALIKSTAVMSIGDFDEEEEDESDTDTYNMEFVQHKRDYYMNKFQFTNVDAEFLRSQAEGYVRAIQWNLYYYYDGCRSWSWYYPHHYAPYISDIKDFKDLQLKFDLEQPFLPFEQLLAVLPPQSKELLPEAFQGLVTEQESPIIDYYPESFYTDLNGKQQEWEAVVLLPFIDEKDLTSAMGPHYEKLTNEEKERNNHGPMCVYTYTPDKIGTCQATYYYPEITNHARLQLVNHEDIIVPREKLVKGLSPGVKRETYYPGFPTFRHLEYTASLEKVKLQNQLMISGSSMILRLKPREELSLWTVASQYLSQVVYVNWPYLREAQVVGVSDGSKKYNLINPQMNFCKENVSMEELRGSLASQWQAQRKNIAEVYKTRLGIEIGEPSILVHARPLVGKRYVFGSHGKLTHERQWADTPQTFAYQVVVKDITVHSPSTQIYKSVADVFKPRTVCFMLGHPYYGSMGHVPEVDANEKSGRIKVWMSVMPSPVLDSLKQKHAITKTHYMEGAIVAQKLGINSHLLSRITGTIYVMQVAGENQEKLLKRNVGLNLKFNKKNLEVPGYTRKENGQWLYSSKTLELVRNYMLKNPALFERLAKQRADILQESDLFDETTGSLTDTLAWLEEQLKGVESCPTGMETLEPSLVQEMEQMLTLHTKVQASSKKVVLMYVKPHLLYVPSLEMRSIAPDPKAQHRLFDRVCCVKDCFTVPLGHKGVIIGIQKDDDKSSSMYNVLFDEPFPGGISVNGCTEGRAYRLGHCDFLNISHGERLEHRKGGDTSTDVNHTSQNRNTVVYSPRKENNRGPVNKDPSTGPVIVKKNNGKSNDIRLAPDVRPWVGNDPKEENQKPTTGQQQENHGTSTVKPSFEFQALWNELHEKTKQPCESQNVPRNTTNARTPGKGNASTVQDPSAVLKAILKIPNGNEQENIEQGPSKGQTRKAKPEKTIDAPPPLVKQLFDQARQNEKGKNNQDKGSSQVRYCLLLLHHYQLTGAGMPRYSYFTDKTTNMIQANILLPDSRVFVGDPCTNHEQAAESAAKKVYTELNIGGMRPDIKNLLPPPIQWRNNAWRQEVRPQVLPGFMPKMQQPPPPQHYHPFIGKMAPKPQFPPPPPPQQQQQQQPGGLQQQQQQQNNQFRPEQSHTEPKVNKSTAFVPLQAQKKSRNVVARQEKKTSGQGTKDGATKVSRHQTGEQTSKRPDTERPGDTCTKQSGGQQGQENAKNPQPTQKSQGGQPKRRSRVAARFGMQVQPAQESTAQNNSGVK